MPEGCYIRPEDRAAAEEFFAKVDAPPEATASLDELRAALRCREGDQVLPTHRSGVVSTHDLMIADLAGLTLNAALREAMAKTIGARRELGLQRYGTVLQPDNGRDCGRDALEEAVDLAAYLRTWMREGAPVAGLYDAVLGVVADLVVRTGGLS
jgi:hypothetical protein